MCLKSEHSQQDATAIKEAHPGSVRSALSRIRKGVIIHHDDAEGIACFMTQIASAATLANVDFSAGFRASDRTGTGTVPSERFVEIIKKLPI
jgi:hypothetical protein